jgi:hypothetical protein
VNPEETKYMLMSCSRKIGQKHSPLHEQWLHDIVFKNLLHREHIVVQSVLL